MGYPCPKFCLCAFLGPYERNPKRRSVRRSSRSPRTSMPTVPLSVASGFLGLGFRGVYRV